MTTLIRPYHPEDDSALMAIEYRSPRGVASPFVHYRRRFVDRTAIYPDAQLFVLEQEGIVSGCIGIAFKTVLISSVPCRVGYAFDLRVLPELRRTGQGEYLMRHVLDYARQQGALGVYGEVVSTNAASLGLLEKIGFQRIRQVLMLEYLPIPKCVPGIPITFDYENDLIQFSPISDRDFYTEGVSAEVVRLDYRRWGHDSEMGFVSLSGFELSKVYRQVSIEELALPEADLVQRSRTLRLFHPQGTDSADLMYAAFENARNHAESEGYYSLSLVVDAEETLPFFFFEQAEKQKRYWLVFYPLHADFAPEWGSPFYVDPRDV